jgi:hypothetical protein
LIRWETGFDMETPTAWWHVIKSDREDIDRIPKKTRYLIRRAAKTYLVRKVGIEQVQKCGYTVYVGAYERYETHEKILGKEAFLNALRALPQETEFWALFDQESGNMVGFSEDLVRDEACFYVTMWVLPNALRDGAGYLLFHEMNRYYLNERKLRYVSDGARSVSHDTEIHQFLIRKFAFRKAYGCLHVTYAPWLAVALFMVFPFRYLIYAIKWKPFRLLSVLLRQEAIRRQCARSGASAE